MQCFEDLKGVVFCVDVGAYPFLFYLPSTFVFLRLPLPCIITLTYYIHVLTNEQIWYQTRWRHQHASSLLAAIQGTAWLHLVNQNWHDIVPQQNWCFQRQDQKGSPHCMLSRIHWYDSSPLFFVLASLLDTHLTIGDQSFDASSLYIRDRFLQLWQAREDRRGSTYSHFTCANDTKNIEIVFNAVCNVAVHGQYPLPCAW